MSVYIRASKKSFDENADIMINKYIGFLSNNYLTLVTFASNIVFVVKFGGVAQLARAYGSYP